MNYPETQGTGSVTNAAATAVLLSAPGAARQYGLVRGIVSITLPAVGAGGIVSLKDGTTTIISFPADVTGSFPFNLGERGYVETTNTALNLVTESAATTQASAKAVVIANVLGF